MPVLTPSLWVPPKGAEEAAGPSAKDHVTGNLPVETPHLHVDGEQTTRHFARPWLRHVPCETCTVASCFDRALPLPPRPIP